MAWEKGKEGDACKEYAEERTDAVKGAAALSELLEFASSLHNKQTFGARDRYNREQECMLVRLLIRTRLGKMQEQGAHDDKLPLLRKRVDSAPKPIPPYSILFWEAALPGES